jgi:hypothetical protein
MMRISQLKVPVQTHQQDLKHKTRIGFRENLEVQKHELNNNVKYPSSHDLQVYFKKNIDFLPPQVAKYFGATNRAEKYIMTIKKIGLMSLSTWKT